VLTPRHFYLVLTASERSEYIVGNHVCTLLRARTLPEIFVISWYYGHSRKRVRWNYLCFINIATRRGSQFFSILSVQRAKLKSTHINSRTRRSTSQEVHTIIVMYNVICQKFSKSNFKYFGNNKYLRQQVNKKFWIDVKISFRYKI